MRAITSAILGVVAASVLVACAGSPGATPTSTTNTGQPSGVQTGNSAALVLDDGDGPQMCVGAVAESYPPQCGGPALIGWDWSDWTGHYEDVSGVKFGNFWIAGEYDVETQRFTVAEAKPASEHEWPDYQLDEVDLSSPCAVPEGGWQVTDPARTTDDVLQQAIQRAEGIEGYAGTWVDHSMNPARGTEMPQGDDDALIEWEMSMNDPTKLILNIRTTGDVVAMDAAVREVWGGMLCVSAGVSTQAELLRIQEEISDPAIGMLGSWLDETLGMVRVSVIYDDGTLRERFDSEYGSGIVEVESVLTDWEG